MMFKFIFILIVLCPSAALAQTAASTSQRTKDVLQQLAMAGLALQLDNISNGKGLLTALPDERTLVENLTDYGFRPDPKIGLTILLPDTSGRPDPKDLVFVAAHNSKGAGVFCYSLPDYDSEGAWLHHFNNEAIPIQISSLSATFNGSLNIYKYNPEAPKGSKISLSHRGLTFDPNTGLVTSTAK